MTPQNNLTTNWCACPICFGRGKTSIRLRKKVKIAYQKEVETFQKSNGTTPPPVRPKANLIPCSHCNGTGIIGSEKPPIEDRKNYPHVAIIGGGIGGTALAVACLHRGIPFTLYERDENFEARSQGYGLTLQQASKAMEELGILSLKDSIISTRHVVHNTDGKILGEWGIRKWQPSTEKKEPKKTNIHIARQSLRLALLKQLNASENIKWGHQLIDTKQENEVELQFLVNGEIQTEKADLVVGADGIRSTVRKLITKEESSPLRYLNCMVILGICPLSSLANLDSPLLDSATVFQTANGHERIYMMPFDAESIMWQLSFPMEEQDAINLSKQGVSALKEEAIKRTQWHDPIPSILSATEEMQITGYPVYDRELIKEKLLKQSGKVTLIGDAAHPMSPFKGQGANQALLDALSLARKISKGCRPGSNWKENGIRQNVLTEFESEMISRSAVKVKGSADAAQFLHSEIVLYEGDEPRGRCLTRENSVLKHNQES